MTTTSNLLTIAQTDELILAACTPEDGAIEDCEAEANQVIYFFETGATGTVSRITGRIEFRKEP